MWILNAPSKVKSHTFACFQSNDWIATDSMQDFEISIDELQHVLDEFLQSSISLRSTTPLTRAADLSRTDIDKRNSTVALLLK